MTTNIDLREAATAIKAAKDQNPTLTDFGFGVFEQDRLVPADLKAKFALEREAFVPAQVATAIAFLRTCDSVKQPTFGSYTLKHRAERWGKNNGFESYVTNGALIVAAHYLGFSIRVIGGPNANIGVSKKSISQRLAEENAHSR